MLPFIDPFKLIGAAYLLRYTFGAARENRPRASKAYGRVFVKFRKSLVFIGER